MPDEFRHVLVSAFPEFRSAAISVAGKGWDSLALDIDGRYIAKFPEGEEPEEALRREARLLAVVRPHLTLPVPQLTVHEGQRLFSLHEKLPGDILLPDGYAALDEDRRGGLAAALAGFFAELHALDPDMMRAAGARPVGLWETSDATLAPVWPKLSAPRARHARTCLAHYRALPPDPLGDVYGFFDAHGWNMAFDHAVGRLNGIFDFADSGFGPLHREFVPVTLVSPDLALRTIAAYEALTGRGIDRRRVYLLATAMRLSEYAGALQTGDHVDWIGTMLRDWLELGGLDRPAVLREPDH